ncbi:MAG: hypothetical protein RBQ99_01755 [Trichlorobacter sp.]|nr:hypothetical protein [Trichlorobacter sp.]
MKNYIVITGRRAESCKVTYFSKDEIISFAQEELNREGGSFEEMAGIGSEEKDGQVVYDRDFVPDEVFRMAVEKLASDGRVFEVYDPTCESDREALLLAGERYGLEKEVEEWLAEMSIKKGILPISFVAAFRRKWDEVAVAYTTEAGDLFRVTWRYEGEGDFTGETYALTSDVESANEEIADCISDAINEGEDGEDAEIFLAVRDTFDQWRVAGTPYGIEVLSVTADPECSGFRAVVEVNGETFEDVYLQLPNDPDSQHSCDGADFPARLLNEIAEGAEGVFESGIDIFLALNNLEGCACKRVDIGYCGSYLIASPDDEGIRYFARPSAYSYCGSKTSYEFFELNEFADEDRNELAEAMVKFTDSLGLKTEESLVEIRPDLQEQELGVPVGDDYYDGKEPLKSRWIGDNIFQVLHEGQWKVAYSIDWVSPAS